MQPISNAESREDPVLFEAQCRSRNSSVDVDVVDISVAGCVIDLRRWSLREKDRVMVKLPGLGFMSASVEWVWDERACLQFSQQLYEPVLAHLLSNRAA